MRKRSKLRIPITLVFLIIFMILGLLGLKRNLDTKEKIKNPYKEIDIIEIGDNNERTLEIFVEEDNPNIICRTFTECERAKLYKVVKTKNYASIVTYLNYANYILITENNDLKIVDLNNDTITPTNLKYTQDHKLILESQSKYDFENKDKKLIGVLNINSYFNYETKENLYINDNYRLEVINKDYLLGTIYKEGKRDKIYILSAKEEKVFAEIKINDTTLSNVIISNNHIILNYINPGNDSSYFEIFDITGTRISKIEENYEKIIPHNEKIYLLKYQSLEVYNYKGIKEATINLEDYDTLEIIQNYIVGTQDNKIVLTNIDDDEKTKVYELEPREKITNIEYKRGNSSNQKSKIGIYITLTNKDNISNEIYFNIDTKEYEVNE